MNTDRTPIQKYLSELSLSQLRYAREQVDALITTKVNESRTTYWSVETSVVPCVGAFPDTNDGLDKAMQRAIEFLTEPRHGTPDSLTVTVVKRREIASEIEYF